LKFHSTPIAGAFLVELERLEDERGFFARSWCSEEFSRQGLTARLAQCNISFNHLRGTLRGLHYQAPPHEEAKLVRCTMGAIYDVIVDVRRSARSFMTWCGFELSSDSRLMLFVPEGVAHGFITLSDNTEVFYQMSEAFDYQCARGLRWNDPTFRISWPITPTVMSDRDRNYDDFTA
jgi:dTDP-4-dehydrorhamnose 3,5-epimerase